MSNHTQANGLLPWSISSGFAERKTYDGHQVGYVLTDGDDWEWMALGRTDGAQTMREAMRIVDAALADAGYHSSGRSIRGDVDSIAASLTESSRKRDPKAMDLSQLLGDLMSLAVRRSDYQRTGFHIDDVSEQIIAKRGEIAALLE